VSLAGEVSRSGSPRRSGGAARPRRGFAAACAIAAAGGLLTAGAFPPVGLALGAVLGPALLAVALRHQRGWRSAVVGLAFGLVFQGVLLTWMAGSIGPAAWVGLTLLQAGWIALLGPVLSRLAGVRFAPLWFAAAWGVIEALRSSQPFSGMPWGRLGFALVDTPWEGLLPYLGVSGAGLVMALAAGMLAELVDPSQARRGVVALALAGLALVALAPLAAPVTPAQVGTLTTAVVQGDVPGDGRQLVAHHREVTQNHVDATRRLSEQVAAGELPAPDLVVWPENSTAVDPFEDVVAREGIESAVDAVQVPVLVGGMVDGPTPDTVLNQGILWEASGPSAERYTKNHPVPFGEYIPFRDVLGGISPRLEEVPRDMVAGTTHEPLMVGDVPVADAICFDVAYDDVIPAQVRRGAQLVIVQTSNASFTGTSQLDQQYAMTRARALETGRAVAVASTNGVTALIGPDGSVIQESPLRTTDVLVEALPLSDELTPAVRWGRYAAWLAAAVLGCGLVLSVAGRRRS
jgi:apolipoprotein N-acyltransferase